MSTLADIILHIVFSTKNRLPWIKQETESELYPYICGICRNLQCPVIGINGVEDHIHLLIQYGRNISVSKLVSEIKSNSSRWIKAKDVMYQQFSWQQGYGVFSVSRANLEAVKKYVSSQKQHHKTVNFQEEFLSMLNKANVFYDEKYLWD